MFASAALKLKVPDGSENVVDAMKLTTRQLKLLLVLLLVGIHRRPNQPWARAFQPTPFRRHPPPRCFSRSMILQATSRRSVVRTANERTALLQKALEVDQQTVQEIVKKYPTFLKYKHETLMERIKWHQDYLDMNGKEIAKLILAFGGFDAGGSIEAKNEKIAAYQSILGLDASQVKKLIRKWPNLLRYSLNSVEDKVEFIAEIFGFDVENNRPKFGQGFLKFPGLLGSSKETISSKVDWFRTTLGLDKGDKWMKRLFQNVPLLCLNVESLEMKRLWLKDRLDLEEAQIVQIVRRHPNIFAQSIEHSLEPKLQWIERRFKIRDKNALGTMICKLPTLFCYSIEANLEPTLDFWTNEIMGGDESKSLKLLANDPILLGFSLERRLLPRWKQFQELGISDVPSSTMFKIRQDKFEAFLERKRLKKIVSESRR